MDAYINRVTIKKDGVYLSSRYKEDKNYHSRLNSSLTAVYKKEGKLGLDREIVRMISEYCGLTGRHKSVERYQFAMDTNEAREARLEAMRNKKNKAKTITREDIDSVYGDHPTEAGLEYHRYCKEQTNSQYTKIAKLCRIYDAGLVEEYEEAQRRKNTKKQFEQCIDYLTNEAAKTGCQNTIAELEDQIAVWNIKMQDLVA